MTETVELPRVDEPGSTGLDENWRVIVLNDNHNTFDGVASTLSRVLPGVRGPGRMGGGRVTQRGLTIVELIPDQNLMLVRGSVPGPRGGTVEVRTDG